MKRLGILVIALVLVVAMSVGVMAAEDWYKSDLPEEDPLVNVLGEEQVLSTSVAVLPFATFVWDNMDSGYGFSGTVNQDFDPSNIDDFAYSSNYIIDPSATEVDAASNVVALAQYKWTMRSNCNTQTTVDTETDTGLSDNVTVFYEFSAEHDPLNNVEWYSYLGPNDSQTFNTQAWADLDEGTETGMVMVGMDPADYKANWTKVKADDYNMKVTFTITGQ